MIYPIQVNVPICPKCANKLTHNIKDHRYSCLHCKTEFIIVDLGKTDRELICEEKIKCQ